MNSASHKKKTIFSFLFVTLFVFLFSSPTFVFALEINYPKVPGAVPPQEFLSTAPPEQILSLYVLYIFNLVIWISGIIAFSVIIYAGIRYLTSAGKPEAILNARKQITDAFLGILILLSSFIILKTLNPQLVVLDIPEPEPVEVTERPETPLPPTEVHLSSIDAEIPFANIIGERIGKERMPKVKNNATTTADIANTLKKQANDLNNAAQQCDCGQANTKTCPVCPGCADDCTCDTCDNQRGTIENLEKKNLEKLDELKAEQKKTIQEIRLLKEELSKLERIENYLIQDCRLWIIQSLREFLIKVDKFKEGGELRQIRFWDDINTIYYSQIEKKEVRDWASLYCPVGGTTFGKQPPTPLLEKPEPGIPEEHTEVVKSCPQEVPIGEIVDRTKRIVKLMIPKLEKLLELQGQMIKAVDEMHVLVSQCSSQKPRCCTKCVMTFFVCRIVGCVGTACPFSQIAQQADKIAEIQRQINELVYRDSDKKEEVGIVPIIDNVVSKLLEDLEREVRLPMRECIIKGGDKVLFDCQRLIGALDPKGDIIRTCCNKEPVFNECLEKCYLEQGQEKYKKCLTECLNKRAEETGLEDISWCRHQLNFFCCNVTKEPLE